jgi:hypothetical protein
MILHRFGFACLLTLSTFVCFAQGATATAALDRWMYPFAFTGGTRDLVPTFSAVGTPGFDNRDGQFLLGFNTTTIAPAGLGAQNYQINAVTVRAMVGAPSGFAYDPTYDSFRTYLPAADPVFMTDADSGRPIELHGIGFRNGYTSLSFGPNDNQPPAFEESSPFGAQSARTRNVYPLGYLSPGIGSDVANNVDDRTESQPWAIGTTSLAAGAVVTDNTTFTFAIDLSDSSVRDYLQRGLNDGALGFAITSLHPAAQAGGLPTPQFITRENVGVGAVPAILDIDIQVVPEPATAWLVAAAATFGFSLMGLRRRRRKLET